MQKMLQQVLCILRFLIKRKKRKKNQKKLTVKLSDQSPWASLTIPLPIPRERALTPKEGQYSDVSSLMTSPQTPTIKVKMLRTKEEFEKELGDADLYLEKLLKARRERKRLTEDIARPEIINVEVVKTEPAYVRKQLEDNTK